MEHYPILRIIQTMKQKNYSVMDSTLNIIGIRSQDSRIGLFNDLIVVFSAKIETMYLEASTEPGLYYLKNLINPSGCAILKPGQYINSYILGLHKGKYKALVQRGGKVTVIRDYDKDSNYDYDSNKEESGYFGINIHRASQFQTLVNVGQYSAGCQVIQKPESFNKFIKVCESSGLRNFTYSLILEKDLLNN